MFIITIINIIIRSADSLDWGQDKIILEFPQSKSG